MPPLRPHALSPFTIGAAGTVVTEEGSVENIKSSAYNILVCDVGFRDDVPTFGVPDITFQTEPIDLSQLQEPIETWEPNANLELEEHAGAIGEAIIEIAVIGSEE